MSSLVKSIKKIIVALSVVFLVFGVIGKINTTHAIDCSGVPFTGNFSLTSTCSFSGTLNGVDSATSEAAPNTAKLTVGTIGTPGSLSILADQTVVVGSLELTNGNITIVEGGSIKIGAPIYVADVDGDGIPSSDTTTQYLTTAVNRARRGLGVDTDDNSYCPDGYNPTGACNLCANGALVNQSTAQDLFDECTAGYNSCSGDNKVGPDGFCNGAGACKTDGLSSACPTKGLCQTGGGCSAGDCVAITDQSPGQDLYSECTAGPYTCSGDNKVGPDGLCNGSGACNTGGYSYACSTARGLCQIAGGCSAGDCVAATNQASNQDLYNECTATSDTCSGDNLISGANGLCNGSGACDAGGSSSACPTKGTCQTGGGCSTGDGGTASCISVTNQSLGQDLYEECGVAACAPGYCEGDGTCYQTAAGTECRASAGTCDSAEYCNGVNGGCPTNVYLPAGQQSCSTCNGCTGSSASCVAITGSGYSCATYCSAGTCCAAAQSCPTCRTSTSYVPNGTCGTTTCSANCSTMCSGSTCCPAAQTCAVCRTTGYSVPDGDCTNTWCGVNCQSPRICVGTVCRLP